MRRFPLAVLVVVGLVASLWAMPAYADELVAGEQQAPETVDLYVLSKIDDMKCTYYSKTGLLKKRANATTAVTFKYSGTNMKSYTSKFKHGRSKSSAKGTLTYDKKGRLAKLVEKRGSVTSTDSYKYNAKGRVSKYTHSATNQKKVKYTCTYDAAGRLATRNASGADKTKAAYAYDDKGNLESTTNAYGARVSTQAHANKYGKAGRLTSRTTTYTSGGSYSTKVKYAYKKVTVPAQYAELVKQQQWALLNPQVSFAYPLDY